MSVRRHGLVALGLVVSAAGFSSGCAAADKSAASPTSADLNSESGAPVAPSMAVSSNTLNEPLETLDQSLAALSSGEASLQAALAESTQLSATGTCFQVCRALASMRRAAERICALDSSRCEPAQARVMEAEARSKDACPVCASHE